MDVPLLLSELGGELRRHWVSALLVGLTLLVLASIAAARWALRRRWQRMIEGASEQDDDIDILPPLGPKDQEALRLIRQMRRQVWEIPETDLRLTVEALSQHALKLVRAIAAVYHEEAETPEYEASLVDSLQLVRRITVKLIRAASLTPFKLLGNQKLSDYQRYYQVYRKLNENPLLQVLKRHRNLYRVARVALNAKNLGNPLYWAGKEISREGYFFMLRWFYMTFTGQVGREAMRLYGGRHFGKEEDRDAALICYRLFALAREWGGPTPADWTILIDFVANRSSLDAEAKLQILSKCSKGKFPKDLGEQNLQTRAGVKWYRRELQRLLSEDRQADPRKALIIENALRELTLARETRTE